MKTVNLVETLFDKNYPFESCILCSFGLNLNFLENYLMNLGALYSCEDICIFTDSGTYDGFIEGNYQPRWLNKKYLVIRLKAEGVFHPKLYMLASEKKTLFGIGSANLSRDGITSNLELLSVFEVSEKDSSHAPLLRDCIEYVRRLAQLSQSGSALDKVNSFAQTCSSYLNHQGMTDLRLVHNLDRPMIEALLEVVSQKNLKKIQVISPFYDSGLEPYKVFRKNYPDILFEIYLQQNKSNFPVDVLNTLTPSPTMFVYHGIDRYMHGKAILMHVDDSVLVFTGSANFTSSALHYVPPKGNYEIALIGKIDPADAEALLSPLGIEAKQQTDIASIETTPIEPNENGMNNFEFLNEVVLNKNTLNISIVDGVSSDDFAPVKIQLRDNNGNVSETKWTQSYALELTSSVRKKVPGKLAMQIVGANSEGELILSNIVWVVELEEQSRDPFRRRTRRVQNDPLTLGDVLREILESGNEEELQHFLLQFHIPIDLILPARLKIGQGGVGSKGNIMGGLPSHWKNLSGTSFQEAFTGCLNRLVGQMCQHVENPQVEKMSNLMLILTSLFSMVRFYENDVVYERFSKQRQVSVDEWAKIKYSYSVHFKYLQKGWEHVWGRGQYRDAINAKLSNDSSDEDALQILSFEQYIMEEYESLFNELTYMALGALENFYTLKNTLNVRTRMGSLVPPKVFATDHPILQTKSQEEMRNGIYQIEERLSRMAINDEV